MEEAEQLYNSPGIPWNLKLALFYKLGQERQGMFKETKVKDVDTGKLARSIARNISTKELRDTLAAHEGKPN